MQQGCIISPYWCGFHHTDSVIGLAEIEKLVIRIGGKLVTNPRYANDIAPCAESLEEAERLIEKN